MADIYGTENITTQRYLSGSKEKRKDAANAPENCSTGLSVILRLRSAEKRKYGIKSMDSTTGMNAFQVTNTFTSISATVISLSKKMLTKTVKKQKSTLPS